MMPTTPMAPKDIIETVKDAISVDSLKKNVSATPHGATLATFFHYFHGLQGPELIRRQVEGGQLMTPPVTQPAEGGVHEVAQIRGLSRGAASSHAPHPTRLLTPNLLVR